jgi:hypothetical protein
MVIGNTKKGSGIDLRSSAHLRSHYGGCDEIRGKGVEALGIEALGKGIENAGSVTRKNI